MTSRYNIEKELGRGAFGITYLGKDNQTGKNVAIKVIDVNKSTEKGANKSIILDELSTMNTLSGIPPNGGGCQPNIACFYDSFEENLNGDPSVVAVSEYIDGGDLDHYVKDLKMRGVPPNPDELWRMMKEMITALDYVHAKGFAHRDIKTDNIMREARTGDLKIIDFGLACTTVCRPGGGTPGYIPVEVINKSAPATLKAAQAHDIFSMGIVFYELANLDTPYEMFNNAGQYVGVDQVMRNIEKDPLTKFNADNYNVNTPWKKSRYNLAQPNAKISNDTFNSIIRMMLDRDWTSRPTARQLVQYMGEEENGCAINGQIYNREQVYAKLSKTGTRFEIDPGYIYLSQLCKLIGETETKNYSSANVAQTYYVR